MLGIAAEGERLISYLAQSAFLTEFGLLSDNNFKTRWRYRRTIEVLEASDFDKALRYSF
jgi:hypothetical protein